MHTTIKSVRINHGSKGKRYRKRKWGIMSVLNQKLAPLESIAWFRSFERGKIGLKTAVVASQSKEGHWTSGYNYQEWIVCLLFLLMSVAASRIRDGVEKVYYHISTFWPPHIISFSQNLSFSQSYIYLYIYIEGHSVVSQRLTAHKYTCMILSNY